MKRLLPIFLAAALVLTSCNADPAEIEKRNKELDQVEQEVLKTREQLLLRVKNLREKLENLIEKVQASLSKRIEDGEDAVMLRLSRELADISPRIHQGFDQTSIYLDQQVPECRKLADEAFSQLGDTRDAIAAKIAQAAQNGDRKMADLMTVYDTEVERVMEKARKAEAAIHTIDDVMDKAGQLLTVVDNASASLPLLDEQYTRMEQMQLDLMEAIKQRATDENSLKIIEDEHLRDIVLYAESLLSKMEDNKSEIQGFMYDSDNLIAQIEDLGAFIEGDIVDGVGGVLADARDAYEWAADLLDFFESTDPAEYYDSIDEALNEADEIYDNIQSYMDELESDMNDLLSGLFDTDSVIDEFRAECSDSYFEAYAEYEKIPL